MSFEDLAVKLRGEGYNTTEIRNGLVIAGCPEPTASRIANKTKRKSERERRREKMEVNPGGTCAGCGRDCEVVEMATEDDAPSFQACDECIDHARKLLE